MLPSGNLCGEYSKLNCNILYIVGIIVWGVHWQKAEHMLADLAYVPAILYDNLKTIKERCKSFLFGMRLVSSDHSNSGVFVAP